MKVRWKQMWVAAIKSGRGWDATQKKAKHVCHESRPNKYWASLLNQNECHFIQTNTKTTYKQIQILYTNKYKIQYTNKYKYYIETLYTNKYWARLLNQNAKCHNISGWYKNAKCHYLIVNWD